MPAPRYVPIDRAKLTPEQQELYDQYRAGPLKPGETEYSADRDFCYILELHGAPMDPPYPAPPG